MVKLINALVNCQGYRTKMNKYFAMLLLLVKGWSENRNVTINNILNPLELVTKYNRLYILFQLVEVCKKRL